MSTVPHQEEPSFCRQQALAGGMTAAWKFAEKTFALVKLEPPNCAHPKSTAEPLGGRVLMVAFVKSAFSRIAPLKLTLSRVEPLNVAPGMMEPAKLVPLKVVPWSKQAPARITFVNCTEFRWAFSKLALVKLAPWTVVTLRPPLPSSMALRNVACCRLDPDRFAPVRVAESSTAPSRVAFCIVACVRFATAVGSVDAGAAGHAGTIGVPHCKALGETV